MYQACLVPRRLSFDENVRAKEGGKDTTRLRLSGRKNVMSMRQLFCPDPLAGFEKMAGFQIFSCRKIKCFHS